MSTDLDVKEYEFLIENGQSNSNRVPIKTFGKLTKIMSLKVASGAPITRMRFRTWEFGDLGAGSLLLSSAEMSEGAFSLGITADGGTFSAKVLAPLAGEVNQDWQLELDNPTTANLEIKLRIV